MCWKIWFLCYSVTCKFSSETEPVNSPLQALSKLVPVPESLMSPDYRPSPMIGRISTPSTIPTPVNKMGLKSMQPARSPKLTKVTPLKQKNNVDSKKTNSPTPPRQRKQFTQSTARYLVYTYIFYRNNYIGTNN